MLRRRLPPTGHLMTSRKLWLKTTPSVDVDVVITFPPDTSETTVLFFKAKLDNVDGLVVRMRSFAITKGTKTNLNCYAFLLSLTPKGCFRGLEQMRIPKRVRPELGGGCEEFRVQNASRFEHVSSADLFVSVQERQSVVKYLVEGVRAGCDDSVTIVCKKGKERRVKFRENEALVPKALSKGAVLQFFPLHEVDALAELKARWVNAIFKPQPLDDISGYFGLKIGFYFAWLGHYTSALLLPAVVGGLVWFFLWGRAELLEDVGFVLFAFFNVIWSTLYLESWKRRQAELAFKWGSADQPNELLDEPRPLYRGVESVNEITGRADLCYPEWRRTLFRYCVTVPVIATALIVVLITVLIILELQQWWDGVIERRGYFGVLRYMPKILLAVVIPLLDSVYSDIAVWLNDQENYRTACQYENRLVVKRALFQFVNSFLALFYTAFYLQDMEKLRELLAALLITRQALGNLKESGLPYLKKHLRLAQMSFQRFGALSPDTGKSRESREESNTDIEDSGFKGTEERQVSQEEVEAAAVPVIPYKGTFEDYLEMLIQFGYVTLFSSAYPLAAFFAWLNNLVEIRGDAFKLCSVHQRPFAQRVASIGTWQTAMEVMGGVGIVVNCALIGLSGQVHRVMPNITPTQTIVLIVALEHAMLGLKLLLSHLVADVPRWVATEMARIEHRRREIEQSAFISVDKDKENYYNVENDDGDEESLEVSFESFKDTLDIDLSDFNETTVTKGITRGTQTEVVLDSAMGKAATRPSTSITTASTSSSEESSGPQCSRRLLETQMFRQKVLSGSANELRLKSKEMKSSAPIMAPKSVTLAPQDSTQLSAVLERQQKIEDVRKRSCDPSVPSVSTIPEDVTTAADKMAKAISDYDTKQLQFIRSSEVLSTKTSSPKSKGKPSVKKMFLAKRMASDSDLWTNTKKRSTKKEAFEVSRTKGNLEAINVATLANDLAKDKTPHRDDEQTEVPPTEDRGAIRKRTTSSASKATLPMPSTVSNTTTTSTANTMLTTKDTTTASTTTTSSTTTTTTTTMATTTTTMATTTGTATSTTSSLTSSSGSIVVNQLSMPESSWASESPIMESTNRGERATASLSMVATSKKLASRMVSKRAMFGKKRSLSVSSFKLMPGRVSKNLETAVEDEDAKYLEQNAVKGELELLDVENLIDVHDVHNTNSYKKESRGKEWASSEARKNWRLARQTLGQTKTESKEQHDLSNALTNLSK